MTSVRPASLQIRREIGAEPLLRDGVERSIGFGGSDNAVYLLQKSRLFLVETDVAGRVLDEEFHLRALGRIFGEDRSGHDIAGRDGVDLTGQEGRDGAVIVLVALDRRIGRRDLRQLEIFDSAARNTDAFACEIFHLGDRKIGGREHAIEEGA